MRSAEEYHRFVDDVSFAPEADKNSLEHALAPVRRLVQRYLEGQSGQS
jgi:hypothetical protein